MRDDRRAGPVTLAEAVRAAADYRPDPHRAPVVLTLPFRGTWQARNSPARRVPSHGTHFLGETFAIDFVAVRGRRTATKSDWRTLVAAEPADRFFGFGRSILAPAQGRVVAVHDGELDHPARRSPVTLLPYALTQASRLRRGLDAVTGNYVILSLRDGGPYVALVHLRAGSLRVRAGDAVVVGQELAECGNSGNSTQPHVHVQVMDSLELLTARGIPMAFGNYRAWGRRARRPRQVREGIPRQGEIVEPVPPGPAGT
jgi:Peptidase family M23